MKFENYILLPVNFKIKANFPHSFNLTYSLCLSLAKLYLLLCPDSNSLLVHFPMHFLKIKFPDFDIIIQTNHYKKQVGSRPIKELDKQQIKLNQKVSHWEQNIQTLETPASRVFLGANAQLLGTSLAGVKCLRICLKSLLKSNKGSLA